MTTDIYLNSSQAQFTALSLICSSVAFCINLLELSAKLQAKEVNPRKEMLRAPLKLVGKEE